MKSKNNFYSVKRELIEFFKYETMLGLFLQTGKRSARLDDYDGVIALSHCNTNLIKLN